VHLAVPIVVVQLGMMAMGLVATIMVGHVSAADLAATGLGNLYAILVVLLAWGALMALDPVVSQAVGAGDRDGVALAVQRGLLLAAGLTVLSTLGCLPVRTVLESLGQPPDVVPLAARYVLVSIPGLLPFFVFIALKQSLQAMGYTRVIVIAIVGANLLHLLLAWALVFGHLGCPRLGVVGAALAATIVRAAMALGLLAMAWEVLRPTLRPLRRAALEPAALGRMLALGLPIGIQMQLEYGIFALVGLLMGRLGTVPMAAHQIALMVASATFMVPQGISGAAAVLVGRDVGTGDARRARRSAAAALGLGAAFMALSGLTLAVLPRPLASLFTRDEPVLAVAALLLPIAGIFQVFDGVQVVSIGVLRGVGDTRTPLVVNLLGFWLAGTPLCVWFAVGLRGGAAGLWWGLVAGLAIVAAILLARVRVRMGGPLRRLTMNDGDAATGA
jgi:MATE family multidrug resistance protein